MLPSSSPRPVTRQSWLHQLSKQNLLIVGLGNPGPNYALNRHNVGFLIVDALAKRLGEGFKSHKSNALIAEHKLGGFFGPKLILAKPNSFMNRSGAPTRALLDYYGISPAQLIVVHDELDLPPQQLRLKLGGGHAGHNGLRSILAAVHDAEFVRLRVGIGRPTGTKAAADYVLQDFSAAERKELEVTIELACDALELLVAEGFTVAQQRLHSS